MTKYKCTYTKYLKASVLVKFGTSEIEKSSK